MRLHVLAKSFAQTQLLRVTFNEMKIVCTELRTKRLNRLRTYLKAWRESRTYGKYMMAANVSTLRFKKQQNTNILKQCFDALRQNKEEEKFVIMEEALNNDCMPAMESLSKEIEVKEKQAVQSGRVKSCKTMEKTLKVWLRSYFRHWKNVSKKESIGIRKELRDKLIRMFRARL